MPKINFCFQGYINDVSLKFAFNAEGHSVNVTEMTDEELANKLTNGELFISLKDFLEQAQEIELHDYTPA